MLTCKPALIVAGCPRQRASLAPWLLDPWGVQSQKYLEQLETYQRQSLFLLRPQGGAGAPHRPVQAPTRVPSCDCPTTLSLRRDWAIGSLDG